MPDTPLASGAAESDTAEYELPPGDSLPRIREAATSISERVRRALAPEGFEPLRVLVVDDHPDAAESLAVVLEMLGCPVRACADGWSALAVAAEFRPQVCLLDLVMPVMDGLELASRLKAWAAGRPLALVAATALGGEETRARTAAAGFHGHLVKPIDAPVLIDTLARLGGGLAGTEHGTPGEKSHDPPPGDGRS